MTHIKTESMDAIHSGRGFCSSDEESVMDLERRETANIFSLIINWKQEEL